MVKLAKLALGTVGVVAAAWSGGWFYGKSEIQSRLNEQVAEWGARGVAVSYQSMDIGGFPFAYRGKLIEPRTQSVVRTALGPARSDWQTPVVTFDSSLADFGVVNFAVPESQRVRFTPLDGAPPMDVDIQSKDLGGRLEQDGDLVRISADGNSIDISAHSQAMSAPLQVTASTVQLIASAPRDEPGKITTYADLSSIIANDSIWNFFDPGESFPRDPANVRIAANGDLIALPDNSITLQALDIEHLGANIAGISVTGEGKAVVQNRIPDGALTLRLQGLGDFIGNAARAGFLPENQASLYRAMLDGFARKGEKEGEQVYTVSFKNGFTYVNGTPTFIPAPQLP